MISRSACNSSLIEETTPSSPHSLREFNASHIDEVIENPKGTHENELFYNCTFKDVRDAQFVKCCLSGSHFTSDDPRDFLGLTVTLDCNTFSNVELSETALLSLLALLLKTSGNVALRRKLIEAIGRDKLFPILKMFETLE